ncbi:DUF1295 domain-containing protein [Pseudobacteriovorax antillogorgiicola]|uniref:Steroid 5-alpha reductase family enzyme n=1 Tax=Pseudobacteriovorax antillogorgiicola TaxID=1513793 RepID=A0A1Y6B9A9_9BACT|nr:DUF1295 domain-containing protein [Pseudobacteriovorax antillogorgiicola]TCS57567.1 steroid 5-alpha reductase family enzyme [Pseudobacteriovorax antillogorgiicola]SME99724.1 Steroid 5-alpha reductase family enzyme [Pseudobacteriovorax antillogorgiicola]
MSGDLLLDCVLSSAALFFLCWLVSLIKKDASIIDSIWGLSFVVHAQVAFWHWSLPSLSQFVMITLVTLWGLRLSYHIAVRSIGKGEDYRYQAMRERNSPGFWWKSLVYIFAFQWLLSVVISAPLFWTMTQDLSEDHSWLVILGSIIWLLGFGFEVVGDRQLKAFKANPENKGQVLDSGLWALTRHPNYFGDGLLWWGYYVLALASGGYLTFFGPLIMSIFLRKVSGVDLLEKRLKKTKPGFEEYMKTTPAFIPDLRKLL